MEARQKILEILSDLRPEYDFNSSKNYIDDGFLDSFDVVSLVSELEDTFDIIIDGLDIIPENFCSIDSIIETINRNGGNL